MEQTLGKRISGYRKKLGLTQDQLAERLGVTAQAVSKWENDQSCPDITTLPKLAEIFGTSTDILLGVTPEEPIRQAEVENAPSSETGTDWTFHLDKSNNPSIFLAIGVILVGGLYLAASLMKLEIGLWDLVWPTALLMFGVSGFIPYRRFSFLRLGFVLFGGFSLINKFVPLQLRLENEVIIACIVLLIGGGLLADALKKPRGSHPIFSLTHHETGRTPRTEYTVSDGKLRFDAAFGDRAQTVVTPLLRSGMINTSFGDYELDLSGVEEVAPNCRLEINTSFGDLTLFVPGKFQVQCANSTAFANVEICGRPDTVPAGTIQLIVNASFGDITVEYI